MCQRLRVQAPTEKLNVQEQAVRQADDRKVFDSVDQDGNGFLTYQDIEKLSREMGETMNYVQLNTIMDSATTHGEMRRIPFDRFEKLCRQAVAWNELDMLACHADLLEQQAEERVHQARRSGAAGAPNGDFQKTEKKNKKVFKPPPEEGKGCSVM